MATPLEAGYSVLGWNHPGFYGSTGVPLPSQASRTRTTFVYTISYLDMRSSEILPVAGMCADPWLVGTVCVTTPPKPPALSTLAANVKQYCEHWKTKSSITIHVVWYSCFE